jgi:hypothetical protein
MGWRRRLVAEEDESSYEGTGGSGGDWQRPYLRGPGVAGDTGWLRRLVLCGGGGTRKL